VGPVQLAEVIDNPEFELVGLIVYSPDKVVSTPPGGGRCTPVRGA